MDLKHVIADKNVNISDSRRAKGRYSNIKYYEIEDCSYIFKGKV